jgi:RecA-family ATPase
VTETTAPLRSPEYLIEEILPSREVHLIGGPSGGGKTTWLFQVLLDWQQGKDVLGHRSNPVPWVYISTDRSTNGVERVLQRMHINASDIPYVSTIGTDGETIYDAMKAGLAKVPGAKLIVIEGMSGLLPSGSRSQNDGGYQLVRRFLGRLNKWCQDNDVTIIGIVHSPKMREDSRYSDPRQRVMGSVAWAAYTETVFLIEPTASGSKETAGLRTLIVLPRNSPTLYLDFQFNANGRLVEVQEDLDDVFVDLFLAKFPPPAEFTTEQFVNALRDKLSRATIFSRLKNLCGGKILKVRHGVYACVRPA